MNNKALNFIKNISYTMGANIISLIVSTLSTLILPKIIGVEEFGYWQLYIFYVSYVGFFHLGWADGIYLRYGGEEYNKLDKNKFFSQFILFVGLQLLFFSLVFAFSYSFNDVDRVFVLKAVSLNLLIMNVRQFFYLLLQTTNRIQEYARSVIFDRLSFVLIIFAFVIIQIDNYELIIYADILAKIISLVNVIWICKDIVFNRITQIQIDFKEIWENVSSGSKLLFANLASTLIIGVVRFGIERTWGVEIFGKVSFSLSISHFLMIFINGVAIVLYPLLRNSEYDKLNLIYTRMVNILMPFSFAILIFFYPFSYILSLWLPKYSESLKYLALLFPLVIYEGKISLLINTFFKNLRKEKVLMSINTLSLILSSLLTVLMAGVFKNLNLTVAVILVVQIFKTFISEVYLSNLLKISILKEFFLEITLTIAFVLSSWYLSSWRVLVFYSFFYIIYLYLKRLELKRAIKDLKTLIKN